MAPTEKLRRHIEELMAIGMTDAMIAQAAGVAHNVPTGVIQGRWKSIGIRYAAALLEVDHRPNRHQAHVLGVGTRRRIEALRALGYSMSDLAAPLGVRETEVTRAYQGRQTVRYQRWALACEVFEALSTTPGRSDRARRHARIQGYLLPMEWEGYDIDDPRVVPPRSIRRSSETPTNYAVDEVLVQRIVDGRHEGMLPKLERDAAFRRLNEAGWSAARIADRLQVSQRTVERLRAAA